MDALKNREDRRDLLQKELQVLLVFHFNLHLNGAHHTSILAVPDYYCSRTALISLNSGRYISIIMSAVTLSVQKHAH